MKRTIENIRNEATGSLDDLCQELTGEEGAYHRDPHFAALLREEMRDRGWRLSSRDLSDGETVAAVARRYGDEGEVEGVYAQAHADETSFWSWPLAWARVGALLRCREVWGDDAPPIAESEPMTQRLPNF